MVIKLGPAQKRPIQIGRNFVWSQKQKAEFDRELAQTQKKLKAKRVDLLEVGAGEIPRGIVGNALKSLRIRKGRLFEASDLYANGTAAARVFGMDKIPKNAKIMRMCSMEHLKQTLAESKDIIFGSYFFNGWTVGDSVAVRNKKMFDFFGQVKRVLKKRGRGVFVIDKMSSRPFSMALKAMGFKVHIQQVTKKQIDNTTSPWLSMLGTKAGREEFIKNSLSNGELTPEMINMYKQVSNIQNIEELFTPHLLIIRK